MGCDIHWVLEKKHDDGWVGVYSTDATPTMQIIYEDGEQKLRDYDRIPVTKNRNYEFFGMLAGVRVDGPDPKGIPDDASQLTKLCIEGWDSDGHSHSYHSAADFAVLWKLSHQDQASKTDAALALLDEDEKTAICAEVWGTYSDDYENYRVVYWFDN